jgi:nitroreductase
VVLWRLKNSSLPERCGIVEAIEAILTRRSIRRYSNEPVSREYVRTIMECAMAAPSADNQQPWQFVVVDDRAVLDAIPKVHPYTQMLKEAMLAIIVCGDKSVMKASDYWAQDCAAATQNILLAARALGLGSCWCGVYPSEKRVQALRELFSMPETAIPFCVISVGHPAEEKPPANRYSDARVHSNHW